MLDADAGVMWINFYEVNTETSNWYYLPYARRGEYEIAVTDLPAGVYYIYAGSDPDNDGYVGDLTEAFGVYPSQDNPALVIGNQDLTGINLYAPYVQPLNSSLSRSNAGSDTSTKHCYLPTVDGNLTLSKPHYENSSGGEDSQFCEASRTVPK